MNIITAWLEATQTAEELKGRISERAGEFYKEQSGRTHSHSHALEPWEVSDEFLHCTTIYHNNVVTRNVPLSWFDDMTVETYEPVVEWCMTHQGNALACYYAGGHLAPCDFRQLYVKS